MIDRDIREYIRIISSISLPQKQKDRLADYLIQKNWDKKEISGKYVVAASALAFIAVGTFLITRGAKQDINMM